jgi:hypothetical protein
MSPRELVDSLPPLTDSQIASAISLLSLAPIAGDS